MSSALVEQLNDVRHEYENAAKLSREEHAASVARLEASHAATVTGRQFQWEWNRTRTELNPTFEKEPNRTGTDMPKCVEIELNRSEPLNVKNPNQNPVVWVLAGSTDS